MIFEREEMLIGNDNLKKISNANIIVFGAGGVGGACIEALVRAGVCKLTVVDNDVVNKSNINRQLIALNSTIGLKKTEVVKKRVLDINPLCEYKSYDLFYTTDTYDQIDLSAYDYVVDCIDTVSSKIHIIEECFKLGIPHIICTGTGNRLNPLDFEICDIFKTSNDPLCRILRKELKLRGIKKCMVLASKELPMNIPDDRKKIDEESKKNIVGSISFVPPVAGMIIAGYVIKELIKKGN